MLQMTYVRPDRITRTSVLEPTAQGYQPVRAAQGVAAQFTHIYGPTVRSYADQGQLGQAETCPVCTPCEAAVTAAATKEEIIAAIAKAFGQGQSIRITDSEGSTIVIHLDSTTRHPFWRDLINRARAMAQRAFGPQPSRAAEANGTGRGAPPRPGAIPVAYGYAPPFDRAKQAAGEILRPGDEPPKAVYLPAQAGGRRVDPTALTADILARSAVRGVPNMVRVRGQANALDWFHREGRYY